MAIYSTELKTTKTKKGVFCFMLDCCNNKYIRISKKDYDSRVLESYKQDCFRTKTNKLNKPFKIEQFKTVYV